MSRQILELSEDTDLLERMKKLAAEEKLDSAWIRVMGTVKNAVFVKADGDDMFCPGVLHLVHGDVVVTTNDGSRQLQASVTVTKDGKSTICGMLKSARIVSVLLHIDSPDFHTLGEATPDPVAARQREYEAQTKAETVRREDLPPSLQDKAFPEQEEMPLSDGADVEGQDASKEAEETTPGDDSWGAVASASEDVERGRTASQEKEEAASSKEGADSSSPWAAVADVSETVEKEGAGKPGKSNRLKDKAEAQEKKRSAAEKLRAYAESAEDYVDVDELSRGDILEHPILGTCRVMRVVDDDSALVQVGGGGRSRKLMLKIFNIIRIDDSRFELEKRKK
jgi:hypothetical protein